MKFALLLLLFVSAGCGGAISESETRTNFAEQTYAEIRGYTVRSTPKALRIRSVRRRLRNG